MISSFIPICGEQATANITPPISPVANFPWFLGFSRIYISWTYLINHPFPQILLRLYVYIYIYTHTIYISFTSHKSSISIKASFFSILFTPQKNSGRSAAARLSGAPGVHRSPAAVALLSRADGGGDGAASAICGSQRWPVDVAPDVALFVGKMGRVFLWR
jgi:hypothetical protein